MGEPEPSTSGARPDQFRRNVLLLKNGDFTKIRDQVRMPTHSEITTIRARGGQYKKEIEFNSTMTSNMVKEKLEETFPYLQNKGFFCAAKNNLNSDISQFDFHGSRHVWNGKTIRRKIKGNSALYILEDDQVDTSGISGSDPDATQEDLSGLIQWLRDVENLQISINPTESPLEGGAPCQFTFNRMLHSEVTTGYATFENLATVPLERLRDGSLYGTIPASPQPGLVSVTLTSQHGIDLGKTNIKYYGVKEVLKKIVRSPILMKEICEEYSMVYGFGETDMEAINSGILGITDPMQLFRLLVYTAAEVGAQQFTEMIFNSSVGRIVFESYKDSSQLPEVVARDHGNEETAQYLERINKRFSDEVRSGKECSQTIDWSELAKAAEAAQKKLDVTNEKEDGLDERNDPKETSYLGDAESSSSEASAPQSSDSEDDISTRTKPTATAATTTTTATRKASSAPAVANVTLRSQDGIILGETRVTKGVNLQQVVSSPRALKKFCEDYMSGNQSGNLSENSGGETESSRTLGCHKPVQMLSLLVYVAAEIGAQQFIDIIFTSSAGRVVHNAYKGNLTLPETIARDHGNEETANYLEDVTKRFSEETTTDDECSQTIDWSELVKAAEAAEKQFDLTSEKEDDKIQKEIPKETGYLGDIDTSSSKSSETQSSDSDDDISRTSRKGSISGRECKIGLQRDQHREDRKGDTEEPNGGIDRDFTETLHQFDLTSKNENGQVKSDDPKETGYLEDADTSSSETSAPQSSDPEDDISVGTTRKTPATTTTATRKGYISGRECQDHKGDTEDPTGGNERYFTETLHQFEVEDIPSTSDFMKEIRRAKKGLQKPVRFSDLSKAQKQEDSKDLKELEVKTKKMISKATDTINSLRTAANKLDEVWKMSKQKQATGKRCSIAGGLLTIAGGIATAMTWGAATPLLVAGMGIGAAGAGANLVTSLKEASINSSEIKKAEEQLKDTRDSMKDVNNTIQFWLKTKEDVRLLYICCLAELEQDTNDLVKKLLQDLVLHSIMLSANVLGVTGRAALSSGMFVAGVAVQGVAKAATTGLADGGAKAAGKVASTVMIGVSAALVIWDAIDLHYTIKAIVENKGSEAARCLRQKADELEKALPDKS